MGPSEEQIRQAIDSQDVVRISYQGKLGQVNIRDINPLAIEEKKDEPSKKYLIAFCNLRGEMRGFLISGILSWSLAGMEFSRPATVSPHPWARIIYPLTIQEGHNQAIAEMNM
jgi:predicted DNA-binding transcriptional regulator YafY